MSSSLPSADDVRDALRGLTLRQLRRLAELSGAAEPTLIKIRYGQIANPGVDTVGTFWPFLHVVQESPVDAADEPQPDAA